MAETGDFKAWMSVETVGSRLIVVPYLSVPYPARLRYEVLSVKQGVSGASTTNQGGMAAVDCCAPRALSRLSLSIREGDRYRLDLSAYLGDRLVARDTLLYPR